MPPIRAPTINRLHSHMQQRLHMRMKRRPPNRRIPRQQTASHKPHLPQREQTICWRASPPSWLPKKPPCNKLKAPKRPLPLQTKPASQRQMPTQANWLLRLLWLRPCNRQRLKRLRLRLPQRPSQRSAHPLPARPTARIAHQRPMQQRPMHRMPQPPKTYPMQIRQTWRIQAR